jgi:predicted flap endonuclease-1-like 5' DNA nuclease
MLYTAGEILLWMILAFLLGLFVGWLLWRWARFRVTEQQWKASEDDKGAQRLRIAELEKQNAELRDLRARDLDTHAELKPTLVDATDTAVTAVTAVTAAEHCRARGDVGNADDRLGRTVVLDDLKVVEGIGPKIEELLHGAGITTWAQLAGSSRESVKAVLDAAGERFQIHEPASWPQQAAHGAWQELKDMQDRLDGGREPV